MDVTSKTTPNELREEVQIEDFLSRSFVLGVTAIEVAPEDGDRVLTFVGVVGGFVVTVNYGPSFADATNVPIPFSSTQITLTRHDHGSLVGKPVWLAAPGGAATVSVYTLARRRKPTVVDRPVTGERLRIPASTHVSFDVNPPFGRVGKRLPKWFGSFH